MSIGEPLFRRLPTEGRGGATGSVRRSGERVGDGEGRGSTLVCLYDTLLQRLRSTSLFKPSVAKGPGLAAHEKLNDSLRVPDVSLRSVKINPWG